MRNTKITGRIRRHQIVEFLQRGPATVEAIRRGVGLASKSILDHHLNLLEQEGRIQATTLPPCRVSLWRHRTGRTQPIRRYAWTLT